MVPVLTLLLQQHKSSWEFKLLLVKYSKSPAVSVGQINAGVSNVIPKN
jgi:hypothetical protein